MLEFLDSVSLIFPYVVAPKGASFLHRLTLKRALLSGCTAFSLNNQQHNLVYFGLKGRSNFKSKLVYVLFGSRDPWLAGSILHFDSQQFYELI